MLSNGQALWAHASTHLWSIERQHPFTEARLADEDLSIDFARHTTPRDRVAVVVTARQRRRRHLTYSPQSMGGAR